MRLFNTKLKKAIALILALLTIGSVFAVATFASGTVDPIDILEDYCVYSTYKANDGYIGIPVGIFDFPLAIAGLVLSIIGKAKCKYDGFATAGIIISIIRIVMKIAVAILIALLLVLVFSLVFIAEGSATVY